MRPVSSLLLILGLLSSVAAPARAQGTTGDIRGVVVDAAGAPAAAVAIDITNPATGVQRHAVTDEAGRFAAPALQPGPYEVTARLPGYVTRRQEGLRLQAGSTIPLRLELTRAALPDTINVSGVPAVIDPARSSQSSVIPAATLQDLPLRNRNALDLISLAPGVTRHASTGEFSVAGQRELSSNLVIDGFDAFESRFGRSLGNSQAAGEARFALPLDAVEEVRVDTAGYPARLGYAAAAVVTVVSRSGSNTFNGSAFDFYRNDALSSNTLLNEERGRPKDRFHGSQFGGALGGPIKRGGQFFFVGYQGERAANTDRSAGLPIPGDFTSRTAPFAFTSVRTSFPGFERQQRRDWIAARTDHRLGSGGFVTGRYRGREWQDQVEIPAALASLLRGDDSPTYRRTASATALLPLRPALVNELAVHYGRGRERRSSSTVERVALFPESGTGVISIGWLDGAENRERRTQVTDTLSWWRGAHLVTAGFDLQLTELERRSELLGLLVSARSVDRRDTSAFVEDAWQVRPSLTLNAGIRYQRERLPDPVELAFPLGEGVPGSTTNADTIHLGAWAPRLGFAWRPDDTRYVVRGGYGLFHGRSAAATFEDAGALRISTIAARLSSLSNQSGDINGFAVFGGGGSVVTLTANPDIQSPRAQHVNAAVEWEWMPYTSIELAFTHVSADRLPDVRVATTGGPFVRLSTLTYGSGAESRYNGVSVALHRRFAQSSYYRVSYTLAKATDTAPGAPGAMPGLFDDLTLAAVADADARDRVPASTDQRHHLAGSVAYVTNQYAERHDGLVRTALRDWTISAVFRVESGQPYSAYVVGDRNGDGNGFNDIAPDTRRNQYNLPAQITLDGRLARAIHTGGRTTVSLMLEVFNARNRPNYTGVNDILYAVDPARPGALLPNPLFGDKVAQAAPRTFQLAARFAF